MGAIWADMDAFFAHIRLYGQKRRPYCPYYPVFWGAHISSCPYGRSIYGERRRFNNRSAHHATLFIRVSCKKKGGGGGKVTFGVLDNHELRPWLKKKYLVIPGTGRGPSIHSKIPCCPYPLFAGYALNRNTPMNEQYFISKKSH